MLKKLDSLFSRIAIFFIDIYQKTLSPDKGLPSLRLKGRICTHEPHCSAYAKECFERYGFLKGLHYTIERVTTCFPREEKHYDPSAYSVVFFSGAPIGVSFLSGLHKDPRFTVAGVVTMPDAKQGRGMTLKENTIKKHARDYGVSSQDIMTPRSLKIRSKKYGTDARNCIAWLEDIKPDFLVVVAYGKIIPQDILDIPAVGPINVHGSLLPAYRGASPLQSVFLDKQEKTGITIMRMHAELDAGDSIDKKEVDISFDMTVKDLIDVFKDIGPSFLQDTLWSYAKGRLVDTPQDHTKASYTSKIAKEDGQVDIFVDTLEEIYAKRKAYALRPKLFFVYKGKRCVIEKLSLDQELYNNGMKMSLVQQENKQFLLHPAVTTLEVKPEGKKTMAWNAFVRGYMK